MENVRTNWNEFNWKLRVSVNGFFCFSLASICNPGGFPRERDFPLDKIRKPFDCCWLLRGGSVCSVSVSFWFERVGGGPSSLSLPSSEEEMGMSQWEPRSRFGFRPPPILPSSETVLRTPPGKKIRSWVPSGSGSGQGASGSVKITSES